MLRGGSLAQEPDLLAVIASTRILSCADEKDHVYGVLGLAIDSKTVVPKPDYSLDFADICQDLAEAVTKARGNLDYFSLLEPRPHHSNAAPWVFNTDIQSTESNYFNGGLMNPSKQFVCHAARDTSPIVAFLSDEQSIILEGYIVDGIDGLCTSIASSAMDDTMIQQDFQSHHDKNQYRTGKSDSETFNALWMTLCHATATPGEEFVAAFDAYGEAFGTLCYALDDDPTLMDKFIDADLYEYFFARWYVENRNFLFGGRPFRSWAQSTCAGNVPQLEQPLNHPHWKTFVFSTFHAPRLSSTDNGYLASVPPPSQPADLICVMF
jgi:hypothetical protein